MRADDDPIPDAAWFDEFAGYGAWESGGWPDPPPGWGHGIEAWHDTVRDAVRTNRLRQELKRLALKGRDLARGEAAARHESAADDPLFFGVAVDAALERIAWRCGVTEDGDGGEVPDVLPMRRVA